MTVRTHRVPLSGSLRSLELHNPAGSTTVEADPDATEVRIDVQALNGIAEELVDRLDLTVTGRSVRLSVPERRLLRAPAFAITVITPPDVAVTAASASADATLRGRLGAVTVTSASGSLTVERCTELHARSASGDIRIGQVDGALDVGNASGGVRVADLGGAARLRTASGDVSLGRVATDAAVRTASGDVRIDRAVSGRLRLSTVSGDATVGVEPGLRIWLELQTVSGRVHSELDDEGAGGGGGAPQLSLLLQSVSGDLRLRRAAPQPPAPPTPPTPPTPPAPPVAPVSATAPGSPG